jgi:hypothetical protein
MLLGIFGLFGVALSVRGFLTSVQYRVLSRGLRGP